MGEEKVKGMLWTGAEKIFVQCIGFVQGVVLARLLSPNDFGLAAMLGIFLGIGTTLAESGLGTAYVVYGGNSRKVFTWNVGIGLLAYAVLALTASAIASFYAQPVLKPLLWLMGTGMVLNAACVVGNARLQRERRFRELSCVNVASILFAFAVAVLMAIAGMGVWAIAWMGIAGALLRVAVFAAKRILLSRDASDGGNFGRMLGYGWKLTLSGLVHTVYLNAYNLIVGKMFSPAAVGLFSRGQRWAMLPTDVVNDSVGRVALPDMAQGTRSARSYLLLNVLLLWPALAVLWLFADAIVGFVLGSAWLDCVPYIKVLLVGVLFTPIANISLQYIRAKGRSDMVLLTDAIKKPIQIGLLVAGAFMLSAGWGGQGVLLLCWVKVASDVVEAATDMAVAVWLGHEDSTMWTREPIDLVYCWCDGKAFEQLEKCRFSNNGELYHSIKSVDRFAPWFRTIWVFVNDGTEIPEWLTCNPRVRIVKHSEVIPAKYLPLYNSVSIEFWLWAIPGLSERFVYANDDMFLGRKCSPRQFFTRDGRAICRYARHDMEFGGSYRAELENDRAFMKEHSGGLSGEWRKALRHAPHHNMDAYIKSSMREFCERFPEVVDAAGKAKFRSGEQLIRDVFSLWAMATGKGVFRFNLSALHLRRDSVEYSLSDTWCYKVIERIRPYMFCLNDTEQVTDEQRRIAKEWMQRNLDV